jgi:threonine/homoserine/homoserine lactone efflux protein
MMQTFGIENYWGFLAAGIILNITPGSDTIYSALGILIGSLIHTLLASFGFSVLLAKSPLSFILIRYFGAAYLTYLGIKIIINKNKLFESNAKAMESSSLIKIYYQGVLTNVLNPKVALFFISFIPQFINPEYANGPVSFLILGLTFVTTGTIWCLLLAYFSYLISRTLRNSDRTGNLMQRVSGAVFIGLGIKIIMDK